MDVETDRPEIQDHGATSATDRRGGGMKYAIDSVGVVLFVVFWLAGIVLSSGWSCLAAVLLPPYAWYLVVEQLMKLGGLI